MKTKPNPYCDCTEPNCYFRSYGPAINAQGHALKRWPRTSRRRKVLALAAKIIESIAEKIYGDYPF